MGSHNVETSFLTPAEAAQRARVTRRCVYFWCRRVPGLAVRVVGRWRLSPVVLEDLLRGQPPLPGGGDHARAA